MVKITSSEITPQRVYQSRRAFMKGLGVSAAGALLLAACGPQSGPAPASTEPAAASASAAAGEPAITPSTPGAGRALMPDESLTDIEAVVGYNNFYEFSTDKEAVAFLADGFKTSPWTVTVGGLVNKPKTFGIEDILAKYTQEERVYRMRCVEGWAMVIPWLGFPLSALLKDVEPSSGAKYVRFETVLDPLQLPGQRDTYYPWPYIEGLRLDEAMHDLTILSTGLYGQSLLPQNGAPLRLVVPWKYGFKSIKSIVKIDLVDVEPRSLWMDMAPHEYGFYANVNPDVAHPRWSQASERRIGELGRRRTLSFNGYGDEVASLYAGMDLRKSY